MLMEIWVYDPLCTMSTTTPFCWKHDMYETRIYFFISSCPWHILIKLVEVKIVIYIYIYNTITFHDTYEVPKSVKHQ